MKQSIKNNSYRCNLLWFQKKNKSWKSLKVRFRNQFLPQVKKKTSRVPFLPVELQNPAMLKRKKSLNSKNKSSHKDQKDSLSNKNIKLWKIIMPKRTN